MILRGTVDDERHTTSVPDPVVAPSSEIASATATFSSGQKCGTAQACSLCFTPIVLACSLTTCVLHSRHCCRRSACPLEKVTKCAVPRRTSMIGGMRCTASTPTSRVSSGRSDTGEHTTASLHIDVAAQPETNEAVGVPTRTAKAYGSESVAGATRQSGLEQSHPRVT